MSINDLLHKVTHLVSHSPVMILAATLAGLILQIYFPIPFVSEVVGVIVGVVLLVVGPAVLWQTRRYANISQLPFDPKDHNFNKGPYKYSRHPVYLSMMMLTLGLAFLANSLILLFITAGLFAFFSMIVIPHEEELLEEKHGKEFSDYKKGVRMWI